MFRGARSVPYDGTHVFSSWDALGSAGDGGQRVLIRRGR